MSTASVCSGQIFDWHIYTNFFANAKRGKQKKIAVSVDIAYTIASIPKLNIKG